MRILLCIAHFFRAEENSRHSSTDARRREQRGNAIRAIIGACRGQFGPTQVLNVAAKRYERQAPSATIEIAVMVDGDNHLLTPEDAAKFGFRIIDARPADPRKLGFSAHRLMAEERNAHDLFVFSEDDLRISDPSFFDKIIAFQDAFGPKRLLMPNRCEWNGRANTPKTFIDGDLRRGLLEPYEAALPDEPFLLQPALGRSVTHRRAGNPHSGFFAITAAQLAHWIRQPHFNDEDCSFVGPLESAATLGMLKTFALYKPFGTDMGWLQLEHLDQRFSGMTLPGG